MRLFDLGADDTSALLSSSESGFVHYARMLKSWLNTGRLHVPRAGLSGPGLTLIVGVHG